MKILFIGNRYNVLRVLLKHYTYDIDIWSLRGSYLEKYLIRKEINHKTFTENDKDKISSIILSKEFDVSVQDVNALVLGGHGDTMVPITRLATIGGIPAEELIPKDRLDAIVERVRFAGGELVKLFGNGSAYYAPAASAIEMAEAYLKDKKRVIPSAALCEGEFGVDGYFIGVPTVIGAGGIEKILEFKLLPEEQEMLNGTLEAVKKTVAETKL